MPTRRSSVKHDCPALSESVEMQVPFHYVDPMQVMWHGHYAKYMEIARCRLLARLELDFEHQQARGFAWPIVKMQQKFVRPARYNQKIVTRAKIVDWQSMLVVDYVIEDCETAQLLMKAQSAQAAVDMKTGETCFVLPDFFRERIEAQF